MEENEIVTCEMCKRILDAGEHVVSLDVELDGETVSELKVCEPCEENCFIIRTVMPVDDEEIIEQNVISLSDFGELEDEEEEDEENEEDIDEIPDDENEFE